jgi:hypothetical protein
MNAPSLRCRPLRVSGTPMDRDMRDLNAEYPEKTPPGKCASVHSFSFKSDPRSKVKTLVRPLPEMRVISVAIGVLRRKWVKCHILCGLRNFDGSHGSASTSTSPRRTGSVGAMARSTFRLVERFRSVLRLSRQRENKHDGDSCHCDEHLHLDCFILKLQSIRFSIREVQQL